MLQRRDGKIAGLIFRDRGSIQRAERTVFTVGGSTDFAWEFFDARASANAPVSIEPDAPPAEATTPEATAEEGAAEATTA
jgi:hypothetical protein